MIDGGLIHTAFTQKHGLEGLPCLQLLRFETAHQMRLYVLHHKRRGARKVLRHIKRLKREVAVAREWTHIGEWWDGWESDVALLAAAFRAHGANP